MCFESYKWLLVCASFPSNLPTSGHMNAQASATSTRSDCACGCLYHFTRREFVARATAFVEGVRDDPTQPECCPWCLSLLAYEVGRKPATVAALQRAIPEFFAQCMRLIVLYSDADTNVPRLRECLAANQRSCPDRATMHRRRLPESTGCNLTDALDMYLWSLFEIVLAGLSSGKRPIDSPEYWRRPPFYNRRGHWPTGVTDLCPGGVEASVDALVRWCTAPPTPHPFRLLATVLLVARAVVLPYILAYPTREKLLWAVLQAASPVSLSWPGGVPLVSGLPPGYPAPRSLRGAIVTVDGVLELFNTVRDGYGCRTREALAFVAGHDRLLLRALEPHMPIYGYAAPTDSGATAHGDMLIETVNMLRALLGMRDSPFAASTAPPPRPVIIRNCTFRWYWARFCANAECSAHELREECIVRFKICEFCRLMRYCSRECQHADWTVGRGEIAHRMVCPLLRKLLLASSYSSVGVSFSTAYDDCDFDELDEDLLHRWALASGILPASRLTLPLPPSL